MIETIRIESDDQWHALRARDVTASQCAALLGIHPYVTPYALHCVKTGKLAPTTLETPAMRRGHLLEPVAVQLIREEYPHWQLQPYPLRHYYRDPETRIGATPDLLFSEGQVTGNLQIKSVAPQVFRTDWHDDAAMLEPPLWIAVQSIIEALLTGSQVAKVAALVVNYGVDLHIVDVPLHVGVITRLKAEVAAFWQRVESDTPPPPDYGRDGEAIARIFSRDDGTEINLTGSNRAAELVDERERLKTAILADKAQLETSEAELKAMLGTHTTGLLPDGRRLQWKLQQRSKYSVPATEFRVLRILQARKK